MNPPRSHALPERPLRVPAPPVTATAFAAAVTASFAAESAATPAALANPSDSEPPSAASAAPAVESAPPAKPARAKRWTPETLAARRRLMASIKRQTRKEVEGWINASQSETYHVSVLSIEITGHLTTAAALQMISHYSEESLLATGNPFVYRPTQTWRDCTGLSEGEWIYAREILRESGLIVERRRFDLELQAIVIEIAFDHAVWAAKIEAMRRRLTEQIQTRMEIDAGVIIRGPVGSAGSTGHLR